MGQATGLKDAETLDLIITNALIIDWNGIYKVRLRPCLSPFRSLANSLSCLSLPPTPSSSRRRTAHPSPPPPARPQADIGITSHRIVGIGKGGNPDVMDGVTPGMVVGVNTEVIAGEKMVVTAGGIDIHGAFLFVAAFAVLLFSFCLLRARGMRSSR